jgi:DNA topoisomerase-1
MDKNTKILKRYINFNKFKNWKYYLLYGGNEIKWKVLQHNGPMFPPEYIPHNIPIIINSEKIILPPNIEEYATMYAKYLNTPYIKNNTFKKNFWKDFYDLVKLNTQLKNKFSNIILDNIDFSLIYEYLNNEKNKKLALSKEEKNKIKEIQDENEKPYKYCIIDGVQQNILNYKIEPPNIFLGRGTHPKIGRIKKRIYPEDVIINLSKDATIPIPNLNNHNWGKIINDQNVIWLASWKDSISNKTKYIFTSFDSFFKSKSDESKFDLAKQLKKKVSIIRNDYELQLKDNDIKNKQLATAMYLIDNLALRVGGNKDTKEEADTVGVISLRVEHIIFNDNNIIKLDFLGKDSIRFCKKFSVNNQVYENLKQFTNNKSKKDKIFDLLSSNLLNEYLNSFMKNLTSKVWRTYNASLLFQKELDKIKEDKLNNMNSNDKLNYLITIFNHANTAVAILCNHQKQVNKSIDETLNKIDIRIKKLKLQLKKYKKSNNKAKLIKDKINNLKLKKDLKNKMKNVSLNTSKNNYIDPRIIFAYIKKYNIPIEKLFTQKSIKRFSWAQNIDINYKF